MSITYFSTNNRDVMYLVGRMASQESILTPNGIVCYSTINDTTFYDLFSTYIPNEFCEECSKFTMSKKYLCLHCKKTRNYIKSLFCGTRFPYSYDTDNIYDFLRGYCEESSFISINKDDIFMTVKWHHRDDASFFMNNCSFPCFVSFEDNKYVVTFFGVNVIEFLYKLYSRKNCLRGELNYIKYLYLINSISTSILRTFKYVKQDKNAVEPIKTRFIDTGFDLTVIKKIKENNGIFYYDTGLQIQPPHGFYFEIVARSSLSKTGWMVANNVGIIDAGYTGNIIVALVRVVENSPELVPPVKIVQLIPRRLHLMEPKQVDSIDISNRGASGGLGSEQFIKKMKIDS